MGEPDKMRMSMVHGSPRLSHIYSDWTMHTPAKPGQAFDEAKLFAEQCRHATFLRKKLIKDLERQTKVMVFWKTDLTDAEIADIDAAVAAYGPNTLLCVRQGNATLAAGEHEWRSDHLMVAAIDRAGNSFPGAGWNISANYWVHFCRIAHQRWQEHRTLPAMPAVA